MSLPTRERGLKYVLPYIPWDHGVAPYAGAWIEMPCHAVSVSQDASLPTRERGLKSLGIRLPHLEHLVAPYAGAWIEIHQPGEMKSGHKVAPYAGAWIEIMKAETMEEKKKVAPYAGAWIEIV